MKQISIIYFYQGGFHDNEYHVFEQDQRDKRDLAYLVFCWVNDYCQTAKDNDNEIPDRVAIFEEGFFFKEYDIEIPPPQDIILKPKSR